jgi:hypothetical protein
MKKDLSWKKTGRVETLAYSVLSFVLTVKVGSYPFSMIPYFLLIYFNLKGITISYAVPHKEYDGPGERFYTLRGEYQAMTAFTNRETL